MNAKILRIPVALGIGAAAFATSFGMARSSEYGRVREALELVQRDRGNTICASGTECLSRGAEYTLFVFFSPRDCASSLYDTVVLDSLYRSVPRSKLNVVAVAYDLSPEEASGFADASRISYPIYVSPERIEPYVPKIRPENTNKPVRVLVHRTGRILSTTTSHTAVRYHHEEAGKLWQAIREGGVE